MESKRSHVVVGLDPEYGSLPPEIVASHPPEDYDDEAEMKAACYRDFLSTLLPAIADVACAVKIQIAYFEALGAARLRPLRGQTVALAQSHWAFWSSPTSSAATSAARPRRTPRRTWTWPGPTRSR